MLSSLKTAQPLPSSLRRDARQGKIARNIISNQRTAICLPMSKVHPGARRLWIRPSEYEPLSISDVERLLCQLAFDAECTPGVCSLLSAEQLACSLLYRVLSSKADHPSLESGSLPSASCTFQYFVINSWSTPSKFRSTLGLEFNRSLAVIVLSRFLFTLS